MRLPSCSFLPIPTHMRRAGHTPIGSTRTVTAKGRPSFESRVRWRNWMRALAAASLNVPEEAARQELLEHRDGELSRLLGEVPGAHSAV